MRAAYIHSRNANRRAALRIRSRSRRIRPAWPARRGGTARPDGKQKFPRRFSSERQPPAFEAAPFTHCSGGLFRHEKSHCLYPHRAADRRRNHCHTGRDRRSKLPGSANPLQSGAIEKRSAGDVRRHRSLLRGLRQVSARQRFEPGLHRCRTGARHQGAVRSDASEIRPLRQRRALADHSDRLYVHAVDRSLRPKRDAGRGGRARLPHRLGLVVLHDRRSIPAIIKRRIW